MSSYLANLEDRIQRLVEGSFARLFAGRLHPREVAIQLARAMEDRAVNNGDGDPVAPDLYIIRVHPLDHDVLLEIEPDLASSLSREMEYLAGMSGFVLPRNPEVRLLADADVPLCEIQIAVESRVEKKETTQSRHIVGDSSTPLNDTRQASLLLNEGRQAVLEGSLITLGRQHDNQIVFDNPSVSRHHAQIRRRFSRFVLFDLGSSGGTKVNGQPVTEVILQQGDVLTLGTETLIYTESATESPSSEGAETETFAPLNP